jgi:hypothetical protein
MVNNTTNINKTKKMEAVLVNNSTNINKANNHLSPKESINSAGQ